MLGATYTGAAQSPQDRAREAYRSGQIQPLNKVLAVVRSRYPGRVVDVDLQRRGEWVYRVKVLTGDGDMLYVAVDARTARVLSVRGGSRGRGRRR